jgi:hypothetical protein
MSRTVKKSLGVLIRLTMSQATIRATKMTPTVAVNDGLRALRIARESHPVRSRGAIGGF